MITNEWILGNGDLSVPHALRRSVFIEEQRVAEEEELDAFDSQAMHLVIYDGKEPVATGRIWHDGRAFRIGRCCVAKEARGQGIGDLLVKLLLLKVFEFNPSEVRINAQTHAERFYERYGFTKNGGEFMEAGIAHVPMRVTKETLVFPSKCGNPKRFSDFFEPSAQ